MRAMVLNKLGRLADNPAPLQLARIPDPVAGSTARLLIEVQTCGVCHTELDEIEGRTPPPRLPIVLGHQVVGRVAALGAGTTGLSARRSRRRRLDLLRLRDLPILPRGARRTSAISSGRPAATPTAAMPSVMTVPEAFAHRIPDALHRRRSRAPPAARARSATGRCD